MNTLSNRIFTIDMEAQLKMDFDNIRFNGSDYSHKEDDARLTGQLLRVFDCMKDGVFRTLGEIEGITNDPQASISAQLRHLRKERFGSHTVNKQPRGNRECGLFEYQLIVNI